MLTAICTNNLLSFNCDILKLSLEIWKQIRNWWMEICFLKDTIQKCCYQQKGSEFCYHKSSRWKLNYNQGKPHCYLF